MKKIHGLLIGFCILFINLASCASASSKSNQPNGHDHTFSTEWEADENFHWHPATCGHDVISDKGEHVYDENSVIYYENETTNDYFEKRYCTICNYEYVKEHSHYYEYAYTEEPDYLNEGYSVYICTLCGDCKFDDFVPPLEHNYATTYSYGDTYHWRQCIDENYTYLFIEMEEHTYYHYVVEPTFEEEGYTIYRCTKCDYFYKVDYVPCLQHNFSTGYESDDYTHWHACVDEGYEYLKSGVEDHVVTDWTIDIEPTDDDEGRACGYCDLCNHLCYKEVPSIRESSLEYLSFKKISSRYSVSLKEEYRNIPTRIIIPESYEELPVTEIAASGFINAINLRSVLIPNTVTSIQNQAFSGCSALEDINIHSGINSIGDEAFLNCVNLENIILKDGLVDIGQNAFKGCYKIFDEYLNGYYIKSPTNPYYLLVDVADTSVARFEIHPQTYIVCPGALRDLRALTYLKTSFIGKCKDPSKVSEYERRFGTIFGYMILEDRTASSIKSTFVANNAVCQYLAGLLAGYYEKAVGYFIPRNSLTIDLSSTNSSSIDFSQFAFYENGYVISFDGFVIPTCVTSRWNNVNYKIYYLGSKDEFLSHFGIDYYYSYSSNIYFYSDEPSSTAYDNNSLWRFVNGEICLWATAYIQLSSVSYSGDYDANVECYFTISNVNNVEYKNVSFSLYYGSVLISNSFTINNSRVCFENIPYASGNYTIKAQLDAKASGAATFTTQYSSVSFKKNAFYMFELVNVNSGNNCTVTYRIIDPFNIIDEESSILHFESWKSNKYVNTFGEEQISRGSGVYTKSFTHSDSTYSVRLYVYICIDNPDGTVYRLMLGSGTYDII